MATPTNYDLVYDTPCDVEAGCGDSPCGGKVEFNARPQVFCKDVKVVPSSITVGGLTFTPKTVVANNGTFICLAV